MKKIVCLLAVGIIISAGAFAETVPLYIFSFATPCLGVANGEIQYSKVPVNPDTVFAQGDDVYVLVEIKSVVGKHRFKVEKSLNGVSYGAYTTDWKNVEEKWVWDYSYFVPSQLDARPGKWKFVIYFGKKNGTFERIAEVNFRVGREDSIYTFTGAVACRGIIDGEIPYSKVAISPDSVFTAGETVYVLTELSKVYIKHRFGVAVFFNENSWNEYFTDWKDVGFGWDYSYFTPRQENIRAGNWKYYIFLECGGELKQIAFVSFRVEEANPTAVKEDGNFPLPFSLSQNFPNPFNPATTISFNLPQNGDACLEVFNLSGQKVAVLADGYLEAGLHQASWNAAGLSAGIYFAKLRSGNFSATTKMTLLK
ncbi:MAG: T9SS type A sorting domain-containing protein [Patescibacteria group bacterium]